MLHLSCSAMVKSLDFPLTFTISLSVSHLLFDLCFLNHSWGARPTEPSNISHSDVVQALEEVRFLLYRLDFSDFHKRTTNTGSQPQSPATRA